MSSPRLAFHAQARESLIARQAIRSGKQAEIFFTQIERALHSFGWSQCQRLLADCVTRYVRNLASHPSEYTTGTITPCAFKLSSLRFS